MIPKPETWWHAAKASNKRRATMVNIAGLLVRKMPRLMKEPCQKFNLMAAINRSCFRARPFAGGHVQYSVYEINGCHAPTFHNMTDAGKLGEMDRQESVCVLLRLLSFIRLSCWLVLCEM
jgi:hypothetical protein